VLALGAGTRVYLACKPVSMRKGFDGLAALTREVFDADPFAGHLFLFRGKGADYFKAIFWDGSGMCLFAKRLEKGRFVWPPLVDGGVVLTRRSSRCWSRASTGDARWHRRRRSSRRYYNHAFASFLLGYGGRCGM